MFRFIFLLFSILLFNLFYVIILDIKFGKALPITFISFFFISFVSGLIGNLSYYKIVIPLMIAILSAIIYIFKRKQSIKNILYRYFNLSFILFIILFIYSWFLYRNYGLNNIDDLYHWSLSVNTIVKSGELFPVGWYVNSYPPFVTWYISMICYLLGGYSESFCLFALSNLCISFIYPFLDKFEYKKKDFVLFIISAIILVLSLLCVNVTEHDQFVFVFNSIYIDWVMAILFAYLVYLIYCYTGKRNDAIYFSLILTALLLTKQVSIPLSMICMFSLAFKQMMNRNLKIKNIFYIVILPLIWYFCWSILLKISTNSQSISKSLNAVEKASISLFNSSSTSIQTVKNFLAAIFIRPIIFHPCNFSYFSFITLLFILLIIYGVLTKKKKDFFSTSIIIYLGSFGFALVMLISYMAIFSDGSSLPLFSRYMQTYTFAFFLICIFVIIDNNILHNLLILLIVTLLVEPKSLKTIYINSTNNYYKIDERKAINHYISDIYNNEKIALISQTNMKYTGSIMFIFYDNQKQKNVSLIQIGKQYNSINDLKDYLGQFEYLLIVDYDEIVSDYWEKITNTPLYNSTIYKVYSSPGNFDIELIEIFEKTN